MLYFINFGMPDHKSGIEHAELKRLKLFEQHDYPCKIIARDWNANLHTTANAAGVDDDHLLGMFDYYQHAEHVAARHLTISDLDFGLQNLVTTDESAHHRYIVKRQNGAMVARVNYDPDHDRQLLSTEMFDGFGNLYCVNIYDQRGFKSLIQWYSPDNKIDNEEWVTPEGQTVIRTYYKPGADGKLTKTGWWLSDHQGVVHQFATMDQLFEYFLNDINGAGGNIFVLDRSLLADDALTRLKKPAYTVMHLHNSQAGDAQDPLHSILNNNYEFALNNINNYSAIVSATQRQTDDVIARFHPTAKTFTIPVGIVPDETIKAPRISEKKRTFGKVVAVARVAPEKRLDHLVRAINIVHQQVPEVTLDLYGYFDPTNNYAAKRKVEELTKKFGLEGVVKLKGYTNDVASVYNDAQIFGLTSIMEGFDLAIMEAISHGVVGVTYDVNYGPNDIIQDGKNGYVVDFDDYHAIADRMIKLFKDPQLMQQMSDGAYDSASRYSTAAVWQDWQALLSDAKQTLKGGGKR